jgi:hypothetical protein
MPRLNHCHCYDDSNDNSLRGPWSAALAQFPALAGLASTSRWKRSMCSDRPSLWMRVRRGMLQVQQKLTLDRMALDRMALTYRAKFLGICHL